MDNENAGFRVWMIRAGEGSYLADEFLSSHIVAIGWNEIGPLGEDFSFDLFKERFTEAYPDDSKSRVNMCVSQLWKFVQEIKIGDKVVTYDSTTRLYWRGEVRSSYQFSKDFTNNHFRIVDWEDGPIDRDALKPETKNTLGAIMTLFELSKEIWDEMDKNHPGYISNEQIENMDAAGREFEKMQLEELKQSAIARSLEFIKDMISKLSWQETEQLAAGLLRALGYKIRMTSKGPDLGSDIIAAPDELGLEEPKIRVEVKKRDKDKIQAPEIRNFIGGMRGHHKGIFITTTGFTKEALYESERANFAITLIDFDWFVELLVNNYDQLDPETKALVPLKRIYWPV